MCCVYICYLFKCLQYSSIKHYLIYFFKKEQNQSEKGGQIFYIYFVSNTDILKEIHLLFHLK